VLFGILLCIFVKRVVNVAPIITNSYVQQGHCHVEEYVEIKSSDEVNMWNHDLMLWLLIMSDAEVSKDRPVTMHWGAKCARSFESFVITREGTVFASRVGPRTARQFNQGS
jgi:hypothetical protein